MKRLATYSYIASFIAIFISFASISAKDSGLIYIQKGQFQQAINYYKANSDSIHLNPSELNNLSVAYYRVGSLGKAILNVDKALKLKPNYRDAQENIKIYRSKLSQDFQPLQSIKLFDFLERTLSINTMIILATIGVLILAVLVLFKWRYRVFVLLLFLTFEFYINGAIISEIQNAKKSYGVILNACEISEGPGNEFISKAKAPEGAEFHLMENKDNYLHVRFLNGIEGWVPKSSLKLI